MTEPLMTVADVCREARMHENTVLRYLTEGRLRGSKLGNRWRIRREDFDAWLDDAVPEPAPERSAAPLRQSPRPARVQRGSLRGLQTVEGRTAR